MFELLAELIFSFGLCAMFTFLFCVRIALHVNSTFVLHNSGDASDLGGVTM